MKALSSLGHWRRQLGLLAQNEREAGEDLSMSRKRALSHD